MVRRSTRRGSSTVEFSFIAFTLILVMLAGFEFDRMLFVYTCLADAASVGERYAIFHGSDRSGTGVDGVSGPADDPDQVTATVKYYTSQLMDSSKLTVHVTYPDGTNATGSRVTVLVKYAYDPWTVLPLNITLSATRQGIIVF